MIFSTIGLLKLTPGAANNDVANVLGYYAPGDGGGGDFYWDDNSTADSDNGIVFQVSGIATGRWKRLFSGPVNVKWFGAQGNNSFDNYAAFAAVSGYLSNSPYGGTMYIPEGRYLLERGVEFNQLVGDESALRRISVNGSGMGSTEIIFTGTGNAFRFYSQYQSAVVQNYSISNFKLRKEGTLQSEVGIKIEYSAFMEMQNVKIVFFEKALLADNFLGASLYSCIFNQNNYGVVFQGQQLAPNDINLFGCTLAGNTTLALYAIGGVTLNIFGGDVEGNGWFPTDARQGGIVIDTGTNLIGGGISANIHGVYFEGNGGAADIMYYGGNGAGLSVLNVYGTTFNRISRDTNRFVVNNIAVQLGTQQNSPSRINVKDCAFRSFNSYIPDAGRRYINVNTNGAVFRFSDEGSSYESSIEVPDIKGIVYKDNNKVAAGVVFRGADASIVNNMGNISTVIRNGIGDYTIKFIEAFSGPWYAPFFSGTEPAIIYVFSSFVDSLRIKAEDGQGNPKDIAAIFVTISGV